MGKNAKAYLEKDGDSLCSILVLVDPQLMRERISVVHGYLLEGERKLSDRGHRAVQIPSTQSNEMPNIKKKRKETRFKQDHIGTKLPLSEGIINSGGVLDQSETYLKKNHTYHLLRDFQHQIGPN